MQSNVCKPSLSPLNPNKLKKDMFDEPRLADLQHKGIKGHTCAQYEHLLSSDV